MNTCWTAGKVLFLLTNKVHVNVRSVANKNMSYISKLVIQRMPTEKSERAERKPAACVLRCCVSMCQTWGT